LVEVPSVQPTVGHQRQRQAWGEQIEILYARLRCITNSQISALLLTEYVLLNFSSVH
jgi:hypothetical protein